MCGFRTENLISATDDSFVTQNKTQTLSLSNDQARNIMDNGRYLKYF